jgi:hypothetical protein
VPPAARPRRTLTARQAWWRAHQRLLKDVREFALARGKGRIVLAALDLHDLRRTDGGSHAVAVTAKACREIGAVSAQQANGFDVEQPDARSIKIDALGLSLATELFHDVASALVLASRMANEEEKAAKGEAAQ